LTGAIHVVLLMENVTFLILILIGILYFIIMIVFWGGPEKIVKGVKEFKNNNHE
jgi:hypothetical protein